MVVIQLCKGLCLSKPTSQPSRHVDVSALATNRPKLERRNMPMHDAASDNFTAKMYKVIQYVYNTSHLQWKKVKPTSVLQPFSYLVSPSHLLPLSTKSLISLLVHVSICSRQLVVIASIASTIVIPPPFLSPGKRV
jgi:hypothetical protein